MPWGKQSDITTSLQKENVSQDASKGVTDELSLREGEGGEAYEMREKERHSILDSILDRGIVWAKTRSQKYHNVWEMAGKARCASS